MMDVNWPNLARVLLTPRLILSKSAPWHCFAKSVRHERVRAGSCLVTQSQNTSERADNQTTSVRLSVSWTLFSYRWHVKVLPTCRQLLQPGRSPPVQYRRIYFGPALSRSASMSQSGSVCDLHSHMPAAAEREVLCCRAGHHGAARWLGSRRFRSRSSGSAKVTSFRVSISAVHLQNEWIHLKQQQTVIKVCLLPSFNPVLIFIFSVKVRRRARKQKVKKLSYRFSVTSWCNAGFRLNMKHFAVNKIKACSHSFSNLCNDFKLFVEYI